MRKQTIVLWLFFLLSLPCLATQAEELLPLNILRQGGMAAGYQPLMIGERSIAAAYLPQTLGEARGAVLLLHDIDEHIDSAAIGILRHQLPAHGWDTLAIKVASFNTDTADAATTLAVKEAAPTIDVEAEAEPSTAEQKTAENMTADNNEQTTQAIARESLATSPAMITTAQRINAALAELQQVGHEHIVLIGQGAGAQLVLQTMTDVIVPVVAIVLIDAGEITRKDADIMEISVPILELFGSRQARSVKQAALARQTQMKTAQQSHYFLRQIVGADHYFSHSENALTNQVHGWLFSQSFDERAAD